MAESALRFICHLLLIFGGGMFIGGASVNFKRGQYAAFGMNVVCTILMIKLLVTI
jgi:hypothetical protein